MILSGSVHEFILADILQLLSQQKATGRLSLDHGKRNAIAILNNGAVVGVEEGGEKLQAKVANYLRTVKGADEEGIENLLVTAGDSPGDLCREALDRGMLDSVELAELARTTIEDFTCRLFAWTKGQYHFESLDKVDKYVVPGVALTADFVIMEAMRRIDEDKRMRGNVHGEAIFVPTDRDRKARGFSRQIGDLLEDPTEYVMSFVDGLTTVNTIAGRVFLTGYRLRQVLYEQWQTDTIAPLSPRLSRSIQAAMAQQERRGLSRKARPALLIGGAAVLAALVLAGASIALQQGLLGSLNRRSQTLRNELGVAQASRKAQIARLHYHALHGTPPQTVGDLTKQGLIARRDVSPITAGSLPSAGTNEGEK